MAMPKQPALGPELTMSTLEGKFLYWIESVRFQMRPAGDGENYQVIATSETKGGIKLQGAAMLITNSPDSIFTATEEALMQLSRKASKGLFNEDKVRLYPRQKKFYDNVVRFIDEYGRSPSNIELCIFMGLARSKRARTWKALKTLVALRVLVLNKHTKTYTPVPILVDKRE